MDKEFVLVRSMRDVVISIIVAVTGIILIICPLSVSVNILGAVIAVPGLLMLFFFKSDYKDVQTGQRYSHKIKYYPASRKLEILDALGKDPSRINWNESASSEGLMLDIFIGKNNERVFVRLSEFVPYNYEPCSKWFSYDEDKVSSLIN